MSIVKYLLAVAMSVLAVSCRQNETETDYNSYIYFRYSYNTQGSDLFAKEVPKMDLLLFDDDGLYLGKICRRREEGSFPGNFNVKLPLYLPHLKRIVALGGEYENAFVISPGTLVPLCTHIDDITLTVKTCEGNTIPGVYHGGRISQDKITSREGIKGMPVNIRYGGESHLVELMKISTEFRILVSVTQNGESIPAGIFNPAITAPNAVLDLNAEPVGSEFYEYAPHYSEQVNGSFSYAFEIWTPRLKGGAGQRLSVKENEWPHTVAFDEDLDELIYRVMMMEEEGSALDFQEFLDRKERFVISLALEREEVSPGTYKYFNSKITIDDWIIRDYAVDP